MDDFVLNVRQIGQFPQQPPAPTDVVLFQQGGQGGPYASCTTLQLLDGAMSGGNTVVCNGPFSATELVLGGNDSLVWTLPGFQVALTYSINGGLMFGTIVPGQGFVSTQFALTPAGNLEIPLGTVQVARDPAAPLEVATRQWVQNNTVWSFNGRTGIVRLSSSDVALAIGGMAATQEWTDARICQSLQQFYGYSPLVFSFNGRTGNICLTLDDINSANFSVPGSYPQAPSPALGDASNNIATTAFVDETIQDATDTINSSWSAADLAILDLLQTQYAPLNSPNFTGQPTAPMPPAGSNDATIPTTAWVMTKITGAVTGVTEWNGRTGQVVLEAADVSGVGGALLASPNFSGSPTAPNPPAADSSQRLATTNWVLSEIGAISAGVTTFNGRAGAVTLQGTDITGAGGAPIASPVFTGTPTAPNPAPTDSSQQLATTAWVSANAVKSWNGRTGAVSLQLNDITAAGGAPLASPTFTGTPAAPTAAPGTNTTQLATTAYVVAAMGAGGTVTSVNGRSGAVVLNSSDISSAGGAVVDNVVPTSGRLIVPGTPPSATLQFQPYNGANIKINGVIYPFSNTQALNNNCYINGVPGQTLANATLYYVYMFYTGTTLALDFSITGHGPSTQIGNYGVEIKAGDNTRTLVGVIRTTATGAFDDSPSNRLCRSWFNRQARQIVSGTISHAMTSINTVVQLTGGSFAWVQFADEGINFNWSCQVNASTANTTFFSMMQVDGTQVGPSISLTTANLGNSNGVAPFVWHHDPAEGYHVANCCGQTNLATTTYSGQASARLIAS